MEHTPHVIVLGAASLDVKGRTSQPPTAQTSTPGTVEVSIGGVARNTAENLARLGVRATLLTVVGDDILGDAILTHTLAAGVNIDYVIVSPERHSGAYMVLLDEERRPVVSLDDMEALDLLTPAFIRENQTLFYGADMVVMDGNVPVATLEAVLQLTRDEGIAVCVDPTSMALAKRLEPYLADIDLFTPNMAEAQVYCDCDVTGRDEAIGVARQLVHRGIGTVIVTLGADGVAYANSSKSGWIPAFPLDELVDPTGVGAALTAGVVFGLLNGVELDEAVRLGASAAALTLQSGETVRSDLSLDLLYEQLMVF